MDFIDFKVLANAAIFSVVGIIIFIIAAFVFEWITPFKMWKEIVENKNVAVAITVGSAFLGLAIIVASAHG
jgi:putative membrane protein